MVLFLSSCYCYHGYSSSPRRFLSSGVSPSKATVCASTLGINYSCNLLALIAFCSDLAIRGRIFFPFLACVPSLQFSSGDLEFSLDLFDLRVPLRHDLFHLLQLAKLPNHLLLALLQFLLSAF